MTILVTGGSGFIGSALLEELVARGHQVRATSRQLREPSAGVEWVECREGLARPLMDRLMDGVDTVFHLAWSTVPGTANLDPPADAATNLVQSVELLEACRARPGVRLVFASSGGTVYGENAVEAIAEDHPTNPVSAYGLSKLCVERYLALYRDSWGVDAVVLRISNPYGISQSKVGFGAVTTFLKRAMGGKDITIYGDGNIVRDYLFISDLVAALCLAGLDRRGEGTLNVGTGVGTSLTGLVTIIGQVLGRPLTAQHTPHRNFDVARSVLDIRRAAAELGWTPRVTLADGIAAMAGQPAG